MWCAGFRPPMRQWCVSICLSLPRVSGGGDVLKSSPAFESAREMPFRLPGSHALVGTGYPIGDSGYQPGNRTCGHVTGRCTLPTGVLSVACACKRSDFMCKGAKRAAAVGGRPDRRARDTAATGWSAALQGAAVPFQKGAVTASKVSVKPQGSLAPGVSGAQ